MYNYYWGMTSAQIQLMTIDCPLYLYKNKEKSNKAIKKELDEKTKRWLQRKKEKEEKGIKFNINDYLAKGV